MLATAASPPLFLIFARLAVVVVAVVVAAVVIADCGLCC